jgi:hypothetical protein
VADGHKLVQWNLDSGFAWTEKAYERLLDQTLQAHVEHGFNVVSTRITGPCPRCDGPLDDRQVHTAIAVLGGNDRGPGAAPADDAGRLPVDVTCDCRITHPSAPAGTTGCGVSFRIELTHQTDGS